MSRTAKEYISSAEKLHGIEQDTEKRIEHCRSTLSQLSSKQERLQHSIDSLEASISSEEMSEDPDEGLIAQLQREKFALEYKLEDVENEILETSSELQSAKAELQQIKLNKQHELLEIQNQANTKQRNANIAGGMTGAYASVGMDIQNAMGQSISDLSRAAAILGGNISISSGMVGHCAGTSHKGAAPSTINSFSSFQNDTLEKSPHSSLNQGSLSAPNNYSAFFMPDSSNESNITLQESYISSQDAAVSSSFTPQRSGNSSLSVDNARVVAFAKRWQKDLGNQVGEFAGRNYLKSITQRYMNANSMARDIFDTYSSRLLVKNAMLPQDEVPHYQPDASEENGRGIYFNILGDLYNERGSGSTFYHEFGHMIDHIAGLANGSAKGFYSNTPDFQDALVEDAHDIELLYINSTPEQQRRFDIRFFTPQWHSASDLLNAATYGSMIGLYAHEPDYWKKPENLQAEAFAHFFEASMGADPVVLNGLKKAFPRSFAIFEKKLESLLSDERVRERVLPEIQSREHHSIGDEER